MANIATSPGVSSTSDSVAGSANWSGNSVALTDASAGNAWRSDYRRHAVGTAFDALHDGCVITNIEVKATTSQNAGLNGDVHFTASYAGVVAQESTYVTTTPTVYSNNGGANMEPSKLRSGGVHDEIIVYCYNNSTFYPSTVTITSVTVTVTYTDFGLTGMMQFSF